MCGDPHRRPGLLAPLTPESTGLPPAPPITCRRPTLSLDAGFLRSIAEGLRGSLAFTVASGGTVLAEHAVAVELLPPSHWGGSGAAPELLAAFVRPNDPAIDVVLRDAAAKLAAAGKPRGDRRLHRRLAPARLGAGRARSGRRWPARAIAYVLPPASFERAGPEGAQPERHSRAQSRDLPRQHPAVRGLPGAGGPQPGRRADQGPRLRRRMAEE